jgi:hypothetical protein
MADPNTNTAPVTDTPEQEPKSIGGSRYLRPDELLRKYSISLTNANADTGILGAMGRFAYDAKRIGEGNDLYAQVVDLFAKQKKESG